MNPGKFRDRVVIVTGSTRGIGEASVRLFHSEGAKVVITGRDEAKGLSIRAELMRNHPYEDGRCIFVKADVTQKENVMKIVEEVLRTFGSIDILVNNAGIVCPAPLEEVKEEDWEMVVKTNLKGSFLCTQAVVPIMKKNRYGKIINIGSRVSLGKLDRTVYAATKAGLMGMTRTWALELAPYNINVNCVGPGLIATDQFKSNYPEDSEKTKTIINSIPLKRIGEPKEVAALISFLASDDASFITGQTIFICGGLSVGLVHA